MSDEVSKSLSDDATLAGRRRQAAGDSLGDERTLGGRDSDHDTVTDANEVVDLDTRYKVERMLGQGGMGAVLLATDTRLGRRVAIKRILGESAGNRTAVARFLTEAKSIAALNHPNIVQIHDYGQAHDGPFLIMEYVDGGSLLDTCKAGPIPLGDAITLACQVCDGLAKAHALGIVHRDIKPANILLTKEGVPKLTDFGLAKAEAADQQMTMTGAVMGTPDFMPPEQQQAAKDVDHRSDLWSLAATLYQMVTGRSPKIIRFNDVPPALHPVLTRALEDKKEERFQSAHELKDALLSARDNALRAGSPADSGGTAQPADRSRAGWRRLLVGPLGHMLRRDDDRTPGPAISPGGTAEPTASLSNGEHKAASHEDVGALAKARRWWRIKEIIESRESQGVPLGEFAEAKAPLEKQLAVFRRVRDATDEAFRTLSPAKIGPYLVKLRELIADHPDIEPLQTRQESLLRQRMDLQKTCETLIGSKRWTALENAIRTFALQHGQASPSVLREAERASTRALPETRRFDLLLWSVLAGATILGACWCVESWLGISDGSASDQLRMPDATKRLVLPAVSVLVRFGAMVAATGFMLAAFGVRHQGSFAGASIGLMVVAAAAQAVPWASSFIPWSASQPSQLLDITISWIPCGIFAVALTAAMQFATSLLIGGRPGFPGLVFTIAALVAGYGFLPEQGIAGSHWGRPEWCRWLPDALLCAGILATCGAIVTPGSWMILPLVAAGVGFIGPSSQFAGGSGMWARLTPVIVGLIVTGWMAVRPTAFRGYLAIVSAACLACVTAEGLRGIDSRSGMPYGRLGPLIGVWAIACAGAALKNGQLLSPSVPVWDMIAKQVLRMRAARSTVAARQLAETEWFIKGRERQQTADKKDAQPPRSGTSPPAPKRPREAP